MHNEPGCDVCHTSQVIQEDAATGLDFKLLDWQRESLDLILHGFKLESDARGFLRWAKRFTE